MDDEASLSPSPLSRLTRRRFLVGATALAVSPLLPVAGTHVLGASRRVPHIPANVAHAGAIAAAKQAATGKALVTGRMSVGYIVGSEAWPHLHTRPWGPAGVLFNLANVVPATSFASGDPRFVGRIAAIGVHGLYPDIRTIGDHSLKSVALDADFRADDPNAFVKFFAWTLRAGPPAMASERAFFRVKVAARTRFAFDMAVNRGDRRTVLVRRFGAGSGGNLAKFRRGAYLLSLVGGTWDTPRTLPPAGDPEWRRLASIVVTIDHK